MIIGLRNEMVLIEAFFIFLLILILSLHNLLQYLFSNLNSDKLIHSFIIKFKQYIDKVKVHIIIY